MKKPNILLVGPNVDRLLGLSLVTTAMLAQRMQRIPLISSGYCLPIIESRKVKSAHDLECLEKARLKRERKLKAKGLL